ncbi:hypothetical protein [Reichenbachiella versicolor]|uniref:hypothetical protein n=1 Tax=Reichenbachiella versicolor TaxID=1821036 RepID=UPI000D6DDCC1|nr:hypothetical protein [Reichenbachiella versicolor]
MALVVLGVWACESEYKAPNELKDLGWLVGHSDPIEDTMYVSIGNSVSFLDLSQGAESHIWSVTSGNYFLNEGFDSDGNLYEAIKSKDTITSNPSAHILFAQLGSARVRFYNTFSDSVTKIETMNIGTSTIADSTGTVFDSELDLWVMDTTFYFRVFDTLKASFKVVHGTETILSVGPDEFPLGNPVEWDTLTVEEGEELTFIDQSDQGNPTGRLWKLRGGMVTSDTDESVTVSYSDLGYNVAGNIRVERKGRFNDIPLPEDSVVKVIPLVVKVVESTEPINYQEEIALCPNGKIRILLEVSVDDFMDQEEFFSVSYTNPHRGVTTQVDVPVTSVSLVAGKGNLIEISVEDPLYNDDDILVTYDGGSIRKRQRKLQYFTDILVSTPSNIELNSIVFGFEGNNIDWEYNSTALSDGNHVEASNEQVSAGNSSLKIISNSAPGWKKVFSPIGIDDFYRWTSGTYNYTIRVYVDDRIGINKVYQRVFNGVVDGDERSYNNNGYRLLNQLIRLDDVDPGDIVSGWTFLSSSIDLETDPVENGFHLTFEVAPNSVGTLYIDEINLVNENNRP